MSQSIQDVLNAARQLPPEERRRLAEQILAEVNRAGEAATPEQKAAEEIVEELYGTIKGLDRETLIWLAEDEELCGY